MSMSSSIADGGIQEPDGQWLEDIASHGPASLLLTPRLGIASSGGGRKGCQDLRVSLGLLCLLGNERQGQAKQRPASIWSRFCLLLDERTSALYLRLQLLFVY